MGSPSASPVAMGEMSKHVPGRGQEGAPCSWTAHLGVPPAGADSLEHFHLSPKGVLDQLSAVKVNDIESLQIAASLQPSESKKQ